MHYALGVDIGTTGVKAGLLNLRSFEVEFVAARETENSTVIQSERLWRTTKGVIREVVDSLGNKEDIVALGISGQMHGAVLYDERDAVIDPIVTWRDRERCSVNLVENVNKIAASRGYNLGTTMACGYTGAILLWIKENDPALFSSIKKFGLIPDFIRSKLIGQSNHFTDPTNAFGTGLFDVARHKWHHELIALLDIDTSIFPTIHETSAVAGKLSKQACREFDLEEIPVIFGGGDNQLGMIGSGISSAQSPILINIGTAAQISKVITEFLVLPGMDTRIFDNEHYALVGASLGGGGTYQWLREEIEKETGEEITFAELDRLASHVSAGADGLVFCTGPSRQNPNRKRGFFGNLSKVRSLGHKARAVMEGVLMDLYENYAVLREYDNNDELIGGGKGLQKSETWSRIAVNMFGKPIRIINNENVIWGAAVLAGIGTGEVQELRSAQSKIHFKEYLPDPGYMEGFGSEFLAYYKSQVALASGPNI